MRTAGHSISVRLSLRQSPKSFTACIANKCACICERCRLRENMPEIGVIQMRCSPDPSENLENGITLIRQAAAQGAQIICLPQLLKTVYFCQEESHKYFQYAAPRHGPTTGRWSALTTQLEVVVVAA